MIVTLMPFYRDSVRILIKIYEYMLFGPQYTIHFGATEDALGN